MILRALFSFMDLIIIVFLFLLGMAIGSFLNVCIYRLPRRESLVFPSSHCPSCHSRIKPYHNIPIISYLLLRGRCKSCRAPIHWHYFAVEVITPFLFILIFWFYGLSVVGLKYVIFVSAGIVIFFVDAIHQIIPDKISLPLILLGFIFAFLPQSDVSITSSLAGALFGFIVFWGTAVVFEKITHKEGLGGGDIKLIAAIGSFTGILGTIFTIIISAFVAFIFLLLIRHDRTKHFSYGSFLIVGAVFYILFFKSLFGFYLDFF